MGTRQDCARCPQMRKCWDMSHKPDDATLAINMLVCRLKLGIKPNGTTKLLLRLLRPKIVRTASWIRQTLAPQPVDFDDLICDLEATTIEYLLSEYRLGERAWPLHYLFGSPSGVIRGWAMRYTNQARREHYTHYYYGTIADEVNGSDITYDFETRLARANEKITGNKIRSSPMVSTTPTYEEDIDAARAPEPYAALLHRVDDGQTFTLSEYRVIRFCLSHAGTFSVGRPSPVSGLHGFLAKHTGVKRQSLTKYYRNASYKLVELAGVTETVLSERGVDTTGIDQERRGRWILGEAEPEDRLTSAEVHGLLNTAENAPEAALVDICWAYGVSDRTYYKLRDRERG